METKKEVNTAQLMLMYRHVNAKSKIDRLEWAEMPLYKSGNRIFGGGDCIDILSHRTGYGFTIIKVMDRGDWYCAVHAKQKLEEKDAIIFYDGTFEEVYERLLEHFT